MNHPFSDGCHILFKTLAIPWYFQFRAYIPWSDFFPAIFGLISEHSISSEPSAIDSPFRVHIKAPLDAAQVQCYGPGLEDGIRVDWPAYFTVDTKRAGDGDLKVNYGF